MSRPTTPPPIPEFYERNSALWAEARAKSPFFEKPYIDRVLDSRPPGSPVLDVGCGTGQPIAEYLLSRGVTLTGCDVSPSMIRKARELFPSSGEWIVADMRALALKRKFGAIIAWDSFFHLSATDQRSVLPRFRDHLSEGGVLLFTSGPSAGEQIGAMYGELLYHASLAPDEYRSILEDLGFTGIAFHPNDPACGNHTVWIAKLPG
jgi:SAM-dependent methyltransferase